MATVDSKTRLLTALRNENTKMHIERDVSGRDEYIYQAPVSTLNGQPCLVTKIQYVGLTQDVDGQVEYESTWDSSWDIVQD